MPTTVRTIKRQSRTKNERRSSSVEVERSLDGYGPYTPVPVPKPVGQTSQSTPPPYRMPPHPLPPLPGATISDPPPAVTNLHTHSSKFPIEREVILSTGDKNNKIPILSEYNKRPKSAVAPEGPTKQLAWTDNAKQYAGQENCSTSLADTPHASYIAPTRKNVDLEKGGGGTKEEKTKITKTYHTIKDMISSRFNRPKDTVEEQKQMNNQTVPNGNERTYQRTGENANVAGVAGEPRRTYEGELPPDSGVTQRVYGSRERLIDGFPQDVNQRTPQRDTRVMPPLPVLRGNHHPNFSGVSEIISPIMPSTPISPQQQQRRLQQNYETEVLSHQQIQRKLQNQAGGSDMPGTYSTARAHLVQTVEGSPQRPSGQEAVRHMPVKSHQEPIYTSGSYLPPHQRRPPPPAVKPLYRDLRGHSKGENSQSSNLVEGQEGNITANLESNGVYISKNPNPKFSQGDNYAYSQNPIYGTRPGLSIPITAEINPVQPKSDKKAESETDDDGGFKSIQKDHQGSSRSLEGKSEKKEDVERETHEVEVHEAKDPDVSKPDRPSSRNEILSANDGLRSHENKVSSATSSDYEKATRRSLGQGSSLGDSGRGSAAYSSGRQDSERTTADYREKQLGKERLDASVESPEGVKRDTAYPQQKSFSGGSYDTCRTCEFSTYWSIYLSILLIGNDSSEWVEIVESELRQILDPKLHGLNSFGSGRGSTMSESVSSLTPPLPPLSPGGGSSPTPNPRHMRYKHSSLPYDSKTPVDDRKFPSGKSQRNGGGGGRNNWTGRTSKNGEKLRSGGNSSRNAKVSLATFGVETDLASTTTGPLESVLDSRLSDHSSDEDLSTTIDATDALAIRRQLQGLENMYSEVLKLLGVKKYGGRYQPTDPRSKRRYGSMSSLPSSVSSRPIRDKRRDDRKKVKDMKGINKRFQRLESHVVTLARSVAHLSSEMRTQHLMIQEMENIRSEISSLRNQTNMNMRSQSVPRALNSMLVSPVGDKGDPSALTNPSRVKKLTKFFGDEPPLLRLFLKKLGYEKYAAVFESEKIGMVELPYLTEERLQKMGIPMGPRLRILQEAQISFCRDSVYIV
ncbi:hypothetical protein RUM43_001614 [Polyplax serrata]|uniref:SAM domain-containing protein n=1 Tax=Polyplax serrata TaxID=468196 RepID=A0AAN8XQ21_POLSC